MTSNSEIGKSEYIAALQRENTAYTPDVVLNEDVWKNDYRSFDLEEMIQVVNSSNVGRLAYQSTLANLHHNDFIMGLTAIAPVIMDNDQLNKLLRALPMPEVKNDTSWERPRRKLEREGLHADTIREASIYGLSTFIREFVTDQAQAQFFQNVLDKTTIGFRDSGGSRGGFTEDGPTVLFNLGIELGKLEWLRELTQSDVSQDAIFTLGVATQAHEGGHVLDASKRLVNPTSILSDGLNPRDHEIPIKWEDASQSPSSRLCRKEMFAEGISRMVLDKLGLDRSVVTDFRTMYFAWATAHLTLLNPTNLSLIYQNSLNLSHRGLLQKPVMDKIRSLHEMTSGHPIATNYPLGESTLKTLLNQS